MNQANRDFETFLTKYKLTMDALTKSQFKKAHSHVVGTMNAFFDYAYELEGQERLKAMRFGKEIKALEKKLYDKNESLKDLKAKVDNNTILSDIAGHNAVKDELMRLIVYPELYPDLYTKFNKRKGGGILFYGVPGTGKTRIAQVVAKDLNAHFIEVKCSDVISKWFGESEKNIREIFDEAREHERSIIFFDEFESLGAVRGKESTGPIGRVISELLSQMQGFEQNDGNIFVIAATNRPWDVDSAFLRPGRFNSLIHIPLPDESARLDIIKSELLGIELEEDFNYSKIIIQTEGFNAADVVDFCERLKDNVIYRLIHKVGPDVITNDDVTFVLSNMKSSVNAKDLILIDDYINGKVNVTPGQMVCFDES